MAWKTCGCGETLSEAQWLALRLVGHQIDEEEDLELRDCPHCGSTLSVQLLADGTRKP